MANVTKIDKCTQHWLITNPLILKINNLDNLKLRLILNYNSADIVLRDMSQVVLDSDSIYKLVLTESERNLIYKLTANVASPKIKVILRAYKSTTLTYEDTKTIDVIINNINWVKQNNSWKKAHTYAKESNTANWTKGTIWHKNSDDIWSR